MEACLCRIASLFNERGILWALGASMLLYYKGLVAQPRDIDLLVSPDDIHKADEILQEIGEKRPANPDAHYSTRYFYEYVVDGVDVDVMAGFVINHAGGSYAYRLEPAVLEALIIRGESVYLCPLEDWFVLYSLMADREDRVRTIGIYLDEKHCNGPRLRAWLNEEIPLPLKRGIQSILDG